MRCSSSRLKKIILQRIQKRKKERETSKGLSGYRGMKEIDFK